MPKDAVPAADGSAASTDQSQPAVSHSTWSPTRLARASAVGALALAAAQMIDMLVTGRQGSESPVRAFETLSRHCVQSAAARVAVGYAVQSTLAPVGAAAAVLAGQRATRRLGAATIAPLIVSGFLNPAFGSAAWPWHWTRTDWTRELTLKSVLALAVITTLGPMTETSVQSALTTNDQSSDSGEE
jgi:hypothetical protein